MISRSLEFNKGKFFRVLAPPIYAFFYKKSLSWLFKYDGEMLDPFLPMLNFNIKKKKQLKFPIAAPSSNQTAPWTFPFILPYSVNLT